MTTVRLRSVRTERVRSDAAVTVTHLQYTTVPNTTKPSRKKAKKEKRFRGFPQLFHRIFNISRFLHKLVILPIDEPKKTR